MDLISSPKILQVDNSGFPKKWLTVKEAICYYATDSVIFELGNPVSTYRGGINRITQQESSITTNSIIAVKGDVTRKAFLNRTPSLTNVKLFERDRYLCAYCGDIFTEKELSRDHIKPSCQGGEDSWGNVVTSCKPCNSKKGGRTLEQSHMSLLYLPYTPDRYENFILHRGVKKILTDQMDFLLSKVNKNSRLKH